MWISVKDRLPELGVKFDVPDKVDPSKRRIYYSSSHVLVAVYNHDEDHKFVQTSSYCPETGGWDVWPRAFRTGEVWNEVTHWQPLPEPPTT